MSPGPASPGSADALAPVETVEIPPSTPEPATIPATPAETSGSDGAGASQSTPGDQPDPAVASWFAQGDTPATPKAPATPYAEILAAWNRAVEGTLLPRVARSSKERDKALRGFWAWEKWHDLPAETRLVEIAAFFKRIADSNFLNGGGDQGFRADLDWAVGPKNREKIDIGRYDNRAAAPSAGTRKHLTAADHEKPF